MKAYFLSILLLVSPLAVSAEGDKPITRPILRRQFRAAAIAQTDGLSVLILGPESVQAGVLVKLDASQTKGDTFNWKLAGGNTESYEVSDDGKKVYFASPTPGTYSFLLAVAKGNGDKPPTLVQAEHKIVIQGKIPDKPTDPTKPDTPPAPVDPLAAGRFGMARFTRDLIVGALPADKRGLASGFSANYALVSSGLKEKTLNGATAAIAEVTKKNQATGGTSIDVWKAPVFVPLGAKINELIKSQVLSPSDTDAWSVLFSEISLGFAAAVGN